MCIQISGVIQTQVEEIYAEMTAEKVLWKRRDAASQKFSGKERKRKCGEQLSGISSAAGLNFITTAAKILRCFIGIASLRMIR